MRLIIIAKLILLAAIITPPVYSHVLMPWTYEKRQAAAQLIVIAEIIQDSRDQAISGNIIVFKVLSTLKGQSKSVVRVMRSTSIAEENLTCCKEKGHYILFLKRVRGRLYQSVHGDYGAVRLVE